MNWKRIKDFASHVASEWEEKCENEDCTESADCPSCGECVGNDNDYCPFCGAFLDWEILGDYDND